MSGFRVRLDALREASDGVDGLLASVRSVPLDGRGYPVEVVGDARVSTAVGTFLERWRTGVDLLARDAGAVASMLRDSVAAYERADGAAADGLVAGPGRDPAGD